MEASAPTDAPTKAQPVPRFRAKTHPLADGSTVTYYFWDGRGRGTGTIGLGKDMEVALRLWEQCEQGVFPDKSNAILKKPLPARQKGKRRTLKSGAWADAPAWMRTMYFNAERRAIAYKRAFTITPADFFALIDRADGKCELTGVPFEKPSGRDPFAPSLDRIDSSKGYEPGNVRLICLIANIAMNTWGFDPLRQLAEHLVRKP